MADAVITETKMAAYHRLDLVAKRAFALRRMRDVFSPVVEICGRCGIKVIGATRADLDSHADRCPGCQVAGMTASALG